MKMNAADITIIISLQKKKKTKNMAEEVNWIILQ